MSILTSFWKKPGRPPRRASLPCTAGNACRRACPAIPRRAATPDRRIDRGSQQHRELRCDRCRDAGPDAQLDAVPPNRSNTRPFRPAFSAAASTIKGRVAQLVEQGIENPRVGGSIPSSATTSFLGRDRSPRFDFASARESNPDEARFDDERHPWHSPCGPATPFARAAARAVRPRPPPYSWVATDPHASILSMPSMEFALRAGYAVRARSCARSTSPPRATAIRAIGTFEHAAIRRRPDAPKQPKAAHSGNCNALECFHQQGCAGERFAKDCDVSGRMHFVHRTSRTLDAPFTLWSLRWA